MIYILLFTVPYLISVFGRWLHEEYITAKWDSVVVCSFFMRVLLFGPLLLLAAAIIYVLFTFRGIMTGSIDRLFNTRFQVRQNSILYHKSHRLLFWSKMREFMERGDSKKDKIQRLCCIHLELFNFDEYDLSQDDKHRDFIEMNEETLFHEILSHLILESLYDTKIIYFID